MLIETATGQSLVHLEIDDIELQPRLLLYLIDTSTNLQYINICGDFWYARRGNLRDVFDALKRYDGLEDCHFYFYSWYLHFNTSESWCQYGARRHAGPCRKCRDSM